MIECFVVPMTLRVQERVAYYILSISYTLSTVSMHQSKAIDGQKPVPQAIDNFIAKTQGFKYSYDSQFLSSNASEFNNYIAHLDTNCLEESSLTLVLQAFETITDKIGSISTTGKYKQQTYQELVLTMLKKLTTLFATGPTRHALKALRAVLKRDNEVFYKRYKASFFAAAGQINPTPFYLKCLELLRSEFKCLSKKIWKMSLQQIVELFEFFNDLQKSRDTKTSVSQLYQEYFSELLAFFQSGRPELKDYAIYDKLVTISYCFERALGSSVKKQEYEAIIPTLAKNLIANNENQRIVGIKLLNSYCKKVFDFYDYSAESDRLKAWLKKNDIYSLILNEALTEEEYETSRFVLKHFGKSFDNREKNKSLLKILNQTKNKLVSKFCLKQLQIYNIPASERDSLITFIGRQEDLTSNYPEYADCIDELVYRMDYDQKSIEPIFEIVYRIMKEAFPSLTEPNQRKLTSNLRSASRYLRQAISKKSNQEKIDYVKKMATDILKEVNYSSILMFNLIFEEGDMQKAFSNNTFHSIMNFVVEDLNLLSRIFQFLQTGENIKDMDQIVKTIKFVANKCSVKIDVTLHYLRTLAKFPDLYESLIANEGHQKIQTQMEAVLDLFRSEPNIPFHLLKATFFKANFKNISEAFKQVSLVNYRREQYSLRDSPNKLYWYEEIISLLEETTSETLRRQIAQFVVSLHINFSNYEPLRTGHEEISKYMESIIDYFHQNTKSYRQGKASTRSVLANFELIKQIMLFTDILGPGKYYPHNSLVSTSTISLTILNNATFGDDVSKSLTRNFPSNMVVFDLLTAAGLVFKCGPEDLVLRQGSRFIPIIYNGCTLEDLNITNQQIVAEKNEANFLKAPQVVKKNKEGKYEFTQPYEKCLREVFNRFSFEGKMGQIEATNYLRQVSGTYVMGYDRRVRQMFQDFDKDKDGILNVEDFLSYNLKSISYSSYSMKYYTDNFLKGLYNLRYRKNITLYNQPLDISNRYHLMMRSKIEKRPQIYEQLFNYIGDKEPEVSKRAKELLLYLPTWTVMRNKISSVFSLHPNSPFLNYYNLILYQDQLSNTNVETGLSEESNRSNKIALFIQNKYNEVIFQFLTNLYHNPDKDQYAFKSFSICLKILRSLIEIPNLTKTDIRDLRLSPGSIHSLPSSNFFYEEALKAMQTKNMINLEVLLVLQLTQTTINLSPIIAGCFSEEQELRRTCCNFIYLWQEKINWKDNLFNIPIAEKYCKQWFDLLSVIIERTDLKIVQEIISKITFNLQKREETLDNRENQVMQGYLQMLKTLLYKYNSLSSDKRLVQTIVKLLDRTVSQKSREIIYDIMLRVDDRLLSEYIKVMLESVLPSQECEVRSNHMGLRNLGATCYINSILQQFFMIEKFRYLILNGPVPEDCKTVEVSGKPLVDDFVYQLQKLYYHLQFSQKKYIVPRQFCYSYKDFDGKPINTSIQEDSHEFLNRLLEQVEQACKKGQRLMKLQQICEVKTLTEFQCGQCKNRIDKVENHYSCMLEVKEQDSLANSLKKFTGKEEIEGYTCEKCKKKVSKISKRTYFHELPEIMILNLQRIIFDPKKGDKIKVHSSLTFPTEIDFTEYVKNPDIQHLQTKYRLKGVVIHTGTSEGGHYYSLIRDKNQKWLKFNDQNVVDFDPKEIERQAFGGFEPKDNHLDEVAYSTNAYILFYESVDAKPIQFCEVENILSEQVHKQNLKLIKQVQVHQECFFTSIDRLYVMHRVHQLEKIIETHPFFENGISAGQKNIYSKLLDIHQKAFSFLSVFTSVRPEVRAKIADNLIQLYHVLPEQTSTFFKELNMETFAQNIISHSDHTFREGIRRIFVRNINIFIHYYGINLQDGREESAALITILDHLLSHLNSNLLYSSFNKSSSFFGLLFDLLRANKYIRIYLMKRQLLFYLLDLIMGRESPFMKHHLKAQDMPNQIVFGVYEIINLIICYNKNLKGIHIQNQHNAPFFQTTLMEATILMNPSFYRRIFRLNYNHALLTNFIYHYSMKDEEYSVMICNLLVQQMNKLAGSEINLFFKMLEMLLGVQDGLQQIRYSCLLGCPQYLEIRSDNYCLSSSGKSDNMVYITGAFPNKEQSKPKMDSEKKPLLQLVFVEKTLRNQNLVLHGLYILLLLSESIQPFFNYLIGIPPPNYHKTCLFDMVPDLLAKLTADQDFILEHKMEKITMMTNLLGLLQERIKIYPRKLPVKPFIIGKTVEILQKDKISNETMMITLRQCKTYVLENVPLGDENKSMGKHFGYHYDVKGTANLFIDYRSSYHYKPEEKVEIRPTVYILKGYTKKKLLVRVQQEGQLYVFFFAEGDFALNLPAKKEGKILDLVDIQLYQAHNYEVSEEMVLQTFRVLPVEKMKQESVDGVNAAPESQKQRMPEDKIQCMHCTYHNELNRQRCDVCDNPLFM